MDATSFFDSIHRGEVAAVRAALAERSELARIAWRVGDGWEPGVTALHVAVRGDRAGLVGLLLDHGADPEARMRTERESRTPLHDAYEFWREEILQLLLDRGAEQDICVAAARADFPRVDELLDAEPSLANDRSSGLTPLGRAGYGSDAAMVPHLLGRGAVLRDEIACPCRTGRLDILQAFLDAGADPIGLCGESGGRPLHHAATLAYSSDPVPIAVLLVEPELAHAEGDEAPLFGPPGG